MSDQNQEVENNNEPDLEAEAREMGWVAEEEYNGPKEKWVDAKTFVERGEQILPIVKAHNKKLKNDLLTRDKEIATLKSSVDNANRAIEALQKHHTAATKKAVEDAKRELREQLKQAREVGDIDAEEEIRDKLTELREEGKTGTEQEDGANKNNQETLNPEFVAWQKENPWFGDDTDPDNEERTQILLMIGNRLRKAGDKTIGRAFMDKCMEELEKREGKNTQQQKKTVSKVEGGTPGARQSGSRPFDSLTKEEKAACHEDNELFVGPGKMFKTVKEWEDHFATLYTKE